MTTLTMRSRSAGTSTDWRGRDTPGPGGIGTGAGTVADPAAGKAPELRLTQHADDGSQDRSLGFSQRLADAGIAASMGSVGDAYDNAMIKSCWATAPKARAAARDVGAVAETIGDLDPSARDRTTACGRPRSREPIGAQAHWSLLTAGPARVDPPAQRRRSHPDGRPVPRVCVAARDGDRFVLYPETPAGSLDEVLAAFDFTQ